MNSILSFLAIVNLQYLRGQVVLLIPIVAFLLIRSRHLSLTHRLLLNNTLLVLSFSLPPAMAIAPTLTVRTQAPAMIMPAITVTSGIDGGLSAPPAMSTYPVLGFLGLVGLIALAFRLLLQIRLELHLRRTASVRKRGGRILVCFSEKVVAPFSSGLLGKSIYLPMSLRKPGPERGMILRHEANHVRGYHSFWLLLETVHRSLFWYNPLGHLLAAGGELDREHHCDATAIRNGSVASYAKMLVSQAEQASGMRQPVLTSSLGRTSLKRRITFLMEGPMRRTSMLSLAVGLPAVLVSILVFSGLSCQSEIVSPTSPATVRNEDPSQTGDPVIEESNRQVIVPNPTPERPAVLPQDSSVPPSPTPEPGVSASLEGNRSRESIMRVVMQNLAGLRYLYNGYLKDNPDMQGRVAVRFSIDQEGKVLSCEVVESTTGNPEFDQEIAARISTWQFGGIDELGDVTTVVYPFTFSR